MWNLNVLALQDASTTNGTLWLSWDFSRAIIWVATALWTGKLCEETYDMSFVVCKFDLNTLYTQMLHFGLSSMDVCHLLLPQLSVAFVVLSCAAAAMRLLHPYWNMQQLCPREPKLKKLKNLHCSIQCTQPLGILGQLMRLSFQVRCSHATCPPQGICRD